MTTFLSVFSGIEAASVAWSGLGWEAIGFAEVAAFPSAVLRVRYPSVPNYGDMTLLADRILSGEIQAPDVIVGGSPCQGFSIAGLRGSLADPRGMLTLKYLELINAIDIVRARSGKPPVIVVWENVPGVLTTADNAFGNFLGGLAGEDGELQPPGRKWAHVGAVYGPARAIAWRLLDAQYFGLAQRRQRVFLVASARNGIDPASIFLEWEGMRRDSPPSRETRKDVAATLVASAGHHGRGSPRGDGNDNLVAHTLRGQPNSSHPPDTDTYVATVAATLDASFGRLQGCSGQDAGHGFSHLIAGPIPFDTTQITSATNGSNPQPGAPCHPLSSTAHAPAIIAFHHNAQSCQLPGIAKDTSVCDALTCSQGAAVAFSCKDSGGDAGTISPTLRAMGHSGSHANGGGQVAVAISGRARGDDGRGYDRPEHISDIVGALDTMKPDRVCIPGMRVRRLTPRECERLMGFPDDYTLIPYGRVSKKKLDEDWIKYLMRGGTISREAAQAAAADGPRYRALGNSMAVPCMAFIGRRIDAAIRAEESKAIAA